MKATQAIVKSGAGAKLRDATRLELLNADGNIVFDMDLPGEVK